jgi:hypothetical protein
MGFESAKLHIFFHTDEINCIHPSEKQNKQHIISNLHPPFRHYNTYNKTWQKASAGHPNRSV